MVVREKEEEEEEGQGRFHGDILDAILSHVPLIHLLSSSHVCTAWRRAALSSTLSNPSRFKPWLVVHIQSCRRRHGPSSSSSSAITTRAYDPRSHEWIKISGANAAPARAPPPPSLLRSSHSSLLHLLSPSQLAFSTNSLTDTWQFIDGPYVWRTDPIVAHVGSHIIVAGGACEFEDDPLAVEIYDTNHRKWDTCHPMPSVLKDSASAMWLSVAVSDRKMYLLQKRSGKFCSFDPATRNWERTRDLRPDPAIFFSVIGFSGDDLVLVGLIGDDKEKFQSLRVWEVDPESLECREMGKMPLEMVQMLKDSSSDPAFIGIAMAEGFVYVYDESNPRDVFFCEFSSGGGIGKWIWGSVRNCDLVLNDRSRMERLVFTCVRVGMDDLREVFGSGKGSFSVMKVKAGSS